MHPMSKLAYFTTHWFKFRGRERRKGRRSMDRKSSVPSVIPHKGPTDLSTDSGLSHQNRYGPPSGFVMDVLVRHGPQSFGSKSIPTLTWRCYPCAVEEVIYLCNISLF
ncbi:hypothetical protein J6590_001287 [Homalodisca vitripennis]|nr:hypothetical protein J6590_001287 [Homalodisca vitripennis]